MKRKLNPKTIDAVKAAYAAGSTYAELARQFGLSAGSVRNALRAAAPVRRSSERAAPSPPPSDPAALPTAEDIRRDLAELVQALRRDVADRRSEGDKPGTATASRLLVHASALLAKATPAKPIDDGMMLVPAAQMQEAARQTRERLHKILSTSPEADGPACAACGRPLARGVAS